MLCYVQIGFVPCSVSDALEPFIFSIVNGLSGIPDKDVFFKPRSIFTFIGVFILIISVQRGETKKMLSRFYARAKLARVNTSLGKRKDIFKAL